MHIVRFSGPEGIAYGTAEAEGIRVAQGSPLVEWEQDTDVVLGYDEVELLSPVLPSKVVCVGKNYVDHAAEMGSDVPETPIIFIKPATSVIGSGAPIVYPTPTNCTTRASWPW
jgi:2-keto-4-pentenoate hydratase/2-oxohepta-3-ene-1,7-dioic acid hydratase in catechol pathway